ncbi:MAG: hypothetical protein ABH827_01580 [bacterium]
MKKILLFALVLIAGTTNIFSMEAPEFTLDLTDVNDSGYDSDDDQYLNDIPAKKELASNLIENKINKLDNLLNNVTSMLKLQEDLTKKDTDLTIDTKKRIDKTIKKIAKKINFTEKVLVKDELKELFDPNFQQSVQTRLTLAKEFSEALTDRYEQLIKKLEEKSFAEKAGSYLLNNTIQLLKNIKAFVFSKKGMVTIGVACAAILVLAFVLNQYFGFVIGLTVDFAKIGNYFVWLGEKITDAAKDLGNGAVTIGKKLIEYGKLCLQYAIVKPAAYIKGKTTHFGKATYNYLQAYLCESKKNGIQHRIGLLEKTGEILITESNRLLAEAKSLKERLNHLTCAQQS